MYWDTKRSKHNELLADMWLSTGGIAHNGKSYGPPSSAVAWGKKGCPLVPFIYRRQLGQRAVPPLMKRALEASHLTLGDLDAELLRPFNMVGIPPQLIAAMHELFLQLPILPGVSIPAGIPVPWLTALPLKRSLRIALGRHFRPHNQILENPLSCADLMAIPAVGKVTLFELLCVLESAELDEELAEGNTSPKVTELTVQNAGQVKLEHSGNRKALDKDVGKQDKTERGEQPRSAQVLAKEALGHVEKREPSNRRLREQDETEHGEQPRSAQVLAKEALGHVEKRESSIRRLREQDETEHGELPRSAQVLAKEVSGHFEKGGPSKGGLRKQGKTKRGRVQAEDNALPARQEIQSNTPDLVFQQAVNEAARQAIRVGFLSFDPHYNLPTVNDGESEVVCSASALGDLFREFANWALSETDSLTFGEAISHVLSETSTSESWQAIAEFELKQATPQPSSPYMILESWGSQLPARESYIFETRIARFNAVHTLQDMGSHLGISRERVRQLEKRVRKKLSILLQSEEARPIRWRAETIRKRIGVAAPLAKVENLLSPLVRQKDYRGIVLGIAGPYDFIDKWLVLKSANSSDPSRKIREMSDEVGFIDIPLATKELRSWGLDSSLNKEWLLRDGKIRNLDGRLVRWDGSIGDKLISALAHIGRPTTTEALLEFVQENRAKTSAHNALSVDPRTARVSRTEWALESWGFSSYSGIAQSIRQILAHSEKPVSIEEVVSRLSREFGMREGSVRAYCHAPMFIAEDGAIRLRGSGELYEYNNASLRDARGVFALGPHRVALLIETDNELLRGSGRALTQAAGAILGVHINESLSFQSREGSSLMITFPDTSIMGPSLGSLRTVALEAGAKTGEVLTIILDRSDMSVSAQATDVSKIEPGWDLVSRLTGVDASYGLKGLAEALQCEEGEVRSCLRNRGDEAVKQALPKRPMSSELDKALANLEAQLQHVRG